MSLESLRDILSNEELEAVKEYYEEEQQKGERKMLQKEFFLRICKYANANWKACLSGTEMNEQAEEMLEEYKISKEEGKFTYAMGELIYNLTDEVVENADAEAEDILNTIMNDFKVRESDGFETE